MSFDTTFDYTNQINQINDRVAYFQNLLTDIGNQITCFNECVGYTGIVESKLSELTRLDTIYNIELVNNNLALLNITNLQALSIEDKDKLYNFMQYTTLSVNNYMGIIATCYAEMLTNTDLLTVLTDTTNTTETKNMIGNIIISNYNKNQYYTLLN